MDKNQKEKELFRSWHERAASLSGQYRFPEIDQSAESYFVKHEDEAAFTEYDFETLPQLKEKLDSMWEGQEYMQEIMRPILAASMKNKQAASEQTVLEGKESKSGEIPVFIYNF